MASVQHHALYDLEKAAFEQDPANAVLLALGKDNEGFARLARNIIHDAPGSRRDGFDRCTPGKPADEYMGKLAKVCIDGEGGLFVMAPPCGHRESVETLFRLFQPFLWNGGHVVLFFVTGRTHPGTLDSVLYRPAAWTFSSGDAGVYHIVTKTGYFYSGFHTPGGWCTNFWSKDDAPKNMTWGDFVLSFWPLKEDEDAQPANESMLKQTERSLQYWAGEVLYSTPCVVQYVRGKERAARC